MSLYRKYRPQTFEDVVGQEHIAQTLRNAVAGNRWAHAYLFCGPRGTGKTTSARLLAKCLNCERGPTAIPCNECDFCTRVRDNQAVMDLIEIDAASNTGVDNVRENIIEKVSVAPAQGRFRVYIIDEVHMLSVSSFNALLKTLEEPPPHAIFVLATTDAHKVPTTITSRCQRFDFRRVGPSDIVRRLQYVAGCEAMQLEDNAARLIARTADGALRDALTLLEQVAAFSPEIIRESDVRLVLGTVSEELLMALVDAVANCDPAQALEQIERATEEGVSFTQLTRDLTNYCRELLLLTVGFESNGVATDAQRQRQHDHSRRIGRDRLVRLVEALRAADKEMRQATDHRLLLELTLVRAASPEPVAVTPATAAPLPAAQPIARPAALATVAPANAAPQPAWRQPQPVPTTVAGNNGQAPRAAPTDTAEVVEATDVGPPDLTPQTAEAQAEAMAVVTVSEVAPPHFAATDAPRPADAGSSEEPSGQRKKGRRIQNLQEFVELWGAVLLRIKKKIGVSAVAYLHDAWPVGLDEKEAVLEFKKEFHFAKACEAATRLPFEQVINECMATPHVLRFELAKTVVKPPPTPEPEPQHSDFDEEDDVLTIAQELFAAEVVGRSGGG